MGFLAVWCHQEDLGNTLRTTCGHGEGSSDPSGDNNLCLVNPFFLGSDPYRETENSQRGVADTCDQHSGRQRQAGL